MSCVRVLFGVWVLILIAPITTYSFTLYITPDQEELYVGDTVRYAVRIDVPEDSNECINIVDAVIEYPDFVQAIDTSVGNSILSLWVEKPTIDRGDRTVSFAGGIPNGYCGRVPGDPSVTNVLTEIILQVGETDNIPDEGISGTIDFRPYTTAYLNDGFGTMADLDTLPANLTVYPFPGAESRNEWTSFVAEDTTPPEPFSIALERNSEMFDGKYYIIFNTTDKQSGIDRYEVLEEPIGELFLFNFGASTAPWREVRSPYVLEDQTLNSVIRVRAIDKAGNYYTASLIPDQSLRDTSQRDRQIQIIGLLIFTTLTIFTLIIIGIYRRRYRRDEEYEY